MREWDRYIQVATMAVIFTIIVFGMLFLYADALMKKGPEETYISMESKAKRVVRVRADKCFKCHRGV